MREHPELQQEAILNNIADRIADATRSHFHHLELVKPSDALVVRHAKYVLFVRAVHSIIGRIHLASQAIRKPPAHRLEHPENALPAFINLVPLWVDFSLLSTVCLQMHWEQVVSLLAGAI